jgi:tRNA A37 methylthiotransferase MiaB
MKKAFIYLAACQRRALDATKIRNYLIKNGYEIINKPKKADIIFFVTCGYAQNLTEGCLNKIKEFQKYDAELIVAGCVPGTDKEELEKIFKGKSITTKNLDQLDNLFPEHTVKFSEIDDTNIEFRNSPKAPIIVKNIDIITKISKKFRWVRGIYFKVEDKVLKNPITPQLPLFKTFSGEDPLYNIRISWGCLGVCSYCAIKKAIGRQTSKPIDQCVKEFKKGLSKGYKIFNLAADDCGTYGLDIGKTLPELIDEILKIPGDYKLSIASISPRWIVKYIDELEEILKRKKTQIVSLRIPVQSGSSRILKMMNRYSDTEKMLVAIRRLNETLSNTPVNTHIMIGFPTETEEEFKQTLNFVKEAKFSKIVTFPFSCKPGTEAEKIEPKVPEDEINRRLEFAQKFFKDHMERGI